MGFDSPKGNISAILMILRSDIPSEMPNNTPYLWILSTLSGFRSHAWYLTISPTSYLSTCESPKALFLSFWSSFLLNLRIISRILSIIDEFYAISIRIHQITPCCAVSMLNNLAIFGKIVDFFH